VDRLPFLPSEKQIEGACGLAVRSATHELFVSDYYHRAVHAYNVSGMLPELGLPHRRQPLAGPRNRSTNSTPSAASRSTAPANLYASEFHQRVAEPAGGKQSSTRVNQPGLLSTTKATYMSTIEPTWRSMTPRCYRARPLCRKSASTTWVDAFGVAVDSQSGRVYVP